MLKANSRNHSVILGIVSLWSLTHGEANLGLRSVILGTTSFFFFLLPDERKAIHDPDETPWFIEAWMRQIEDSILLY